MVQQAILPEDEQERKAGAIKTLSLGLFAATVTAQIIGSIIWLFDSSFPILPFSLVSVVVILTCLVAYWLVRFGHVRVAGYFFIIGLTVICSIVTYLFGGAAGPIAIIYAFPILMTAMVISLRSIFLIATVSSIFFIGVFGIEMTGFFPQVMAGEWEEIAAGSSNELRLAYLSLTVRVVSFYVVAFLGWFVASRLERALQTTRQYAAELQTANEELQASDEELRSAKEKLEDRVKERTAELEAANEELRETQEQLVRSEKLAAIGQLAGGVGHELRNPLGAIKNAVYYIRGKMAKSEIAQQEPRVMEFLDIMDEEINSSNKIIDDLLGFSRVGKPAVSPARIEKVINDAITQTPIPENIEFTKKLGDGLPEVEIDTDQIRQVLINMITNALQAMPEEGKLTIGARAVDNSLQVEITDTGVGIAKEDIDKIFDPLYTMKAKGIGLGLAVCQSIIERHEGHIEVKSQVGKGTTFTIKLPLKVG